MAWIESHQALGHHPKTLRLADTLGCSLPTAVGHLQFLWWWALDYAPDGRLKPGSQLTIARACEWRGKPEKFWQGLVEAGFVEETEEGGRIHDWMDYAGRLVDKRAANAARMRNARAGHVQRTSGTRAEHVQGLPTGPDQPDQPDQTGPDQPIPPNPPSDQPKGGDGSETCPDCEMLVDRNGDGHGLTRSPGRVRRCSLDHRKPYEWAELVATGVSA